MKRVMCMTLALAGLTLGLGACSDKADPNVPSVTLVAAVNSPIVDVPVPAGWQLDTSTARAESLFTTNQRRVNHTYRGDDSPLVVVRFYKDKLPTKGWQSVSQIQDGEAIIMKYVKAGENLTVTVGEGSFWSFKFSNSVNVEINPDPQKLATPK
ncbi:MAG: hypothetical protein WCJ97_01900 [Phycisphaerae bacterium]